MEPKKYLKIKKKPKFLIHYNKIMLKEITSAIKTRRIAFAIDAPVFTRSNSISNLSSLSETKLI